MKFIKMKCPSCGGELEVQEDVITIKCGFCGSKVIIDDKATEISRVKKAEINARKEQDEYEFELREKTDKYINNKNYQEKKNRGGIKIISTIMTIVCLLCALTALRDGMILSGIIGIIQVFAFIYTFLMCMEILPEKQKNLYKITFIFGILLSIIFIFGYAP